MKTQICKECGCIGKPSKALLNQLVSFDDFGNDAGKPGTTQSRHGEAKEVDCLKCPNCGHSWIPEKSDREQAIEWWINLNLHQQTQLYLSYFGCKATDKFPDEIEQIWRKETHFQGFFEIKKEDRVQVDFEMLRDSIDDTLNLMSESMVSDGYIHNLKLFFELLSKSSTFAHKAHKELNRLNNK